MHLWSDKDLVLNTAFISVSEFTLRRTNIKIVPFARRKLICLNYWRRRGVRTESQLVLQPFPFCNRFVCLANSGVFVCELDFAIRRLKSNLSLRLQNQSPKYTRNKSIFLDLNICFLMFVLLLRDNPGFKMHSKSRFCIS